MTPNDVIDICEADIFENLPALTYPIDHTFIPGPPGWFIYERTVYVPAGTILTSVEHKVEHMYNLSKGSFAVVDSFGNSSVVTAPSRGVTKPGTRRLVYVLEDIEFTTYMMTQDTDPEGVIEKNTEPNRNPLLSERDRRALKEIRSSMPTRKELE